MRGCEVTAPDGTVWRVGRQWRLWRPRRRDVDLDPGSGLDLTGDLDDFLLGIALGALLVLGLLLLGPLVGVALLGAEVVLALLLAPLAVLWWVALRRPWIVYAEAPGRHHQERVVGFANARRTRDSVAQEIMLFGEPKFPG
jgi:hypothetical protein